MEKWLRECEAHHAECRLPDHTKLLRPARFVDVSIRGRNKDVRLVIAGNNTSPNAVQSHVWGPADIEEKTTQRNLNNCMANINYDGLPATFQDGIALVRALRIEYIWIDSLCIVQDSQD